jgi:hypothetical protein
VKMINPPPSSCLYVISHHTGSNGTGLIRLQGTPKGAIHRRRI